MVLEAKRKADEPEPAKAAEPKPPKATEPKPSKAKTKHKKSTLELYENFINEIKNDEKNKWSKI